jgi:O-antigen/teichoic acid export membrane protein
VWCADYDYLPWGVGVTGPRVSALFSQRSPRQVGWGIVDQALSSAANFGLAVVAARSLSTADFGLFSLAFSAYTFAIGLSRALTSEPLVIGYSQVPESLWRRGTSWSSGASLLLGLVSGLLALIVGVAIGSTAYPALLALGVTLPGLLVQDNWRFAFFARGRGHLAFENDLVWAVVQFSLIVPLVLAGQSTVGWLILAWGGAAAVAALAGARRAGVVPATNRAMSWWRQQRQVAPRILLEFLAVTGASQISNFGIAAIAGLTAVGAIRGAQVLMGPANVLVMGVALVAIPESIGLLKRSGTALRRGTILLSLGLGIISLAWGGILLLIPPQLGIEILGPTWRTARIALPGVILWQMGLALSVGAVAGLRALGLMRRSVTVRVAVAPLIVLGALIGAFLGGASSAALGLGTATLIGAGLWWLQLERSIQQHEASVPRAD